MLKLQRLEISGFKTFVDPVTTEFAEGITAIVGPNGCGKSNLSEAVTWVLGEQSAKSLRGGKMEDVIFNGSDRRRPLGMAEVSLTFQTALDNGGAAESHADEQGRITIGRRVFRSGESQYRINDRLVRLKDIKDMLMDTGLGVRAYSVIEQGRIGMILSGKPQDRRKLIEEAAGITRYKARKQVAEVKLEEATGNLMRLDDIIAEVERALRSLKRQASAARRYQEREQEYKELAEVVLRGRWARMRIDLDRLELQLKELADRDAEAGAELSRGEADLAAGRERLDELSQELAERHRREAELAATIEGRQEYLRATRETLDEIGERLGGGTALARQRGGELETARESLARLSDRGSELEQERARALAEVAEDERRLQAAIESLRTAERELEELRTQLLASMNRVTSVQNRLHQEQIESEKGSYRRQHLMAELEQRREQLEKANQTLAETRERLAGLRQRLEQLGAERQRTRTRLDETLRLEAEVSERLQRLDREIASAENRRKLLEELARAEMERRAKLREAMTAVGLGDLPFLDDRVEVPEGWERSLDLYLEQLRDAVLLPAEQDPMALAEALAASDSSGTLLRASDPEERWSVDRPYDCAIVASLGEALGLPRHFADSLPPAFLVESAADAERLGRRHPGMAFISRDRLWAQNGVLHLQGRKATPGTLARNRELRDIENDLPRLRRERDEAEQRLDQLVEERTELARELNRLEESAADLRQQLAVAEAREQDALATQRRLQTDHDTLAGEHAGVEDELERLAERRAGLQEELDRARAAHGQLEEKFDAAQQAVTDARERREQLKTEGAGRQGRLQLLDERFSAQDFERVRLQQQIQEIVEFLAGWGEQEARLGERRRSLEESIANAERELEGALERRGEAHRETEEGRQRLDAQREEVQRLAAAVEESRSSREALRAQIQELRVDQAGRRQELGHVEASYRESFSRELPSEAGVRPEAGVPDDLEQLEERLAETRTTLERLGPVNLLAAQEYEEQEERYSFLSEQREDVLRSVQSLKATIREINQTSMERFVTTFEEVNRRFGETFAQLFRGGEAMMRVMDEEDPLESGIEIVARPPGKRPQNINLLSGGEKALTAIALLFALFKTKPSPFCILDEVDAPLDDANVLRFVDMLRGMSDETQFLIITHNKLTMEAASTLYGVTMEEKGVSKIVGVEVDQLHPRSAIA